MGTKKGQVRKTARRAYEPKKMDVGSFMDALTNAIKRRDKKTTKKLLKPVMDAGIDPNDLFKLKRK